MDKRTLLALALIMVIYLFSSKFLWNKKVLPKNKSNPTAVSQSKQDNQVDNDIVSKQVNEKEIAISDSANSNFIEIDVINDNIVLENDKIKFVFSNKGALLKSVFLKDYFQKDSKSIVQLLPTDEKLFQTKIQTNQEIDTSNKVFSYFKNENKITFELKGNNEIIKKSYSLDSEYNLSFNLQANLNNSIKSYDLDFASGFNDTEEYVKYKGMDYKAVVFANNILSSFKLDSIKKANKKNERLFDEEIEKISWATLRTKFFMIGVLPEERALVNDVKLFTKNDSPAMILTSNFGNQIYSEINDNYDIYFGPIIQKNLEKYGKDFIKSSELIVKWYRPLCQWFNVVLNYINKIVNNFGLSIIIFALLIKLALYPLTHKSFESSQKMKKVQPELRIVQKKYKSDPKQMQVEMNKLYKEHGVNPLGGCLPLLFQMPILLSLYPVLRYSIHLRQVSFLWLPDLSAPDTLINLPFNIPMLGSNLGILPILMALFMFLQQKMMMPDTNPTADMDEKQLASLQSQKMMMYVMPVMMFVFFNNFPSGLVLYWTIFNIFSMGQQYLIKKKF